MRSLLTAAHSLDVLLEEVVIDAWEGVQDGRLVHAVEGAGLELADR